MDESIHEESVRLKVLAAGAIHSGIRKAKTKEESGADRIQCPVPVCGCIYEKSGQSGSFAGDKGTSGQS